MQEQFVDDANSIVELYERTVRKFSDNISLRILSSDKKSWKSWTWNEHFQTAKFLAQAFLSFGVSPGDSIAVISSNRPEYAIASFSAALIRAVLCGIYTSSSVEVINHILEDSKAKVVIIDSRDYLKKLSSFPKFNELIIITTYLHSSDSFSNNVFSWDQFITLGKNHDGSDRVSQLMRESSPSDVLCLIYTSGTIGFPKACMITNDNVCFIAKSVLSEIEVDENERFISYLPISHIAAALLDVYAPAIVGFSTAFDPTGLQGTLIDTMKLVKPTIFFGVPRVYEKIQDRIQMIGLQGNCLVKFVSKTAKEIGTLASEAREKKLPLPWSYFVADFLVFSRIRKALGLEHCRGLFSAAAPLKPTTLAYFASLSLQIYEVYGLSESTGPVTANLPDKYRSRTCGKPLPGCEVMIVPIDDGISARERTTVFTPNEEGEICLRGRSAVFKGYKGNPEATAAVIDSSGYLHTGDLGYLDEHGYLVITGRLKELIKTSGGEFVPPLRIENLLKERLKLIANAIVIGEGRKFLTVLFTLRTRASNDGFSSSTELDDIAVIELQRIGITGDCLTVSQAMSNPIVHSYIQSGIDSVNSLAINNAQKIQKYRILPIDFSVENDCLTATLKVKRRVINSKFAKLIDDMYS
jgi:long-chain-fatty-acid--CoA ligase ACSBG